MTFGFQEEGRHWLAVAKNSALQFLGVPYQKRRDYLKKPFYCIWIRLKKSASVNVSLRSIILE